ncbi:mitotic-spindle organizing protein associated with a ring of gamma-tubulin 1 [Thamnocephalis sphaerospora]|uniref:Mitotic-spindle organizing protein 1 n=1 Tax=Thamnocephalis sphaerospora TaxID=78915 RepID=A0A4P9XX55_9FUNG|nr:mitotic-spindle organizing protein associated with a ring of gamma-tubulin 1 [Thamnocephalis sphaerospora]|eukprot:RKP10030.1 mitotic-spindle organizing protein associated with a ring of gamma-tubulin 1 [Thamnocephalis sphaerospora]
MTSRETKAEEARETLRILYEISSLLNTGLDREQLSLCVKMCERGVNPEALAAVVKELRREAAAIKGTAPDDPEAEAR